MKTSRPSTKHLWPRRPSSPYRIEQVSGPSRKIPSIYANLACIAVLSARKHGAVMCCAVHGRVGSRNDRFGPNELTRQSTPLQMPQKQLKLSFKFLYSFGFRSYATSPVAEPPKEKRRNTPIASCIRHISRFMNSVLTEDLQIVRVPYFR